MLQRYFIKIKKTFIRVRSPLSQRERNKKKKGDHLRRQPPSHNRMKHNLNYSLLHSLNYSVHGRFSASVLFTEIVHDVSDLVTFFF